MENFFNALKVSIVSLVTSIILYVVTIRLFLLSVDTASTFGIIIKVTVPILALAIILEFIYSFFIINRRNTSKK